MANHIAAVVAESKSDPRASYTIEAYDTGLEISKIIDNQVVASARSRYGSNPNFKNLLADVGQLLNVMCAGADKAYSLYGPFAECKQNELF